MRELQNVVERAVILARGGVTAFELPVELKPNHALPPAHEAHAVPKSQVMPEPEIISEQLWLDRERANLLAALAHSNNRVSGKGGAADLLGINPATLTSRLKKFGIRPGRSNA